MRDPKSRYERKAASRGDPSLPPPQPQPFGRLLHRQRTPDPVDYLTGSYTHWTEYSPVKGAFRWQTALHEYVGAVSRRVQPERAGRTMKPPSRLLG